MLRRLLAALGVLLLAAGPAAADPAGGRLVVFAAASLKTALDEVAALYRRSGGAMPTLSYAASSALARQIESGAPADLFISADEEWMSYLEEHSLLRPGTRRDLLANTLVLVAPAADARPIALAPGVDLAARLGGGGRLAMADPDAVPAGKYGKAALQALGAWDGVAGRLARAENVRAALAFVARGEAPLGIVYATDAAAEPAVRIVATFPPESHKPIVYPAAVAAASRGDDAAGFLAFLGGPAARAVFEKQGFRVLVPAKSAS